MWKNTITNPQWNESKPILRCHPIIIWIAMIKKLKDNKCTQGCEKTGSHVQC
jgi:hypothetical protein